MMTIRPAYHTDAEHLTAIAHEAKRHWGYPDELIALWRDALTITPGFIDEHITCCTLHDAEIAGFYAISHAGRTFELEHMWVQPRYMGRGCGSRMFAHAVETIRAHGGTMLLIASDPNAEAFYLRMGALRIGDVPSTPEGRRLPLLAFDILSDHELQDDISMR